jgi:hypothetical protein
MLRLPVLWSALALIAAACGGSDDEAEVVLVAGARDGQATVGDAPVVGPNALLPDLVVRQPGELWIQSGEDGVREIRFSTSVANLGDGPLEMLGRYEESTQKTLASQRILYADGNTTEHEIGRFLLHPQHQHWHFEDFFVFELWTVKGERLEQMVATTGKLTFCLVDSYPAADPVSNGVAKPSILECNSEVQGLSSGWEETYEADWDGQELDIPEMPDGIYAIRTIVDPDDRVHELNEGNNESVALVQITGDDIVVLGEL